MQTGFKLFSEKDIKAYVDYSTYTRGFNYFMEGRVLDVKFHHVPQDDYYTVMIVGTASGSNKQKYTAHINVHSSFVFVEFHATCSCPVSYDCKHVVAILFAALAQSNNNVLQDTTDTYDFMRVQAAKNVSKQKNAIESLKNIIETISSSRESKNQEIQNKEAIVYTLEPEFFSGSGLSIKLYLSKLLKKGVYGAKKKYSKHSIVSDRATTQIDMRIISYLQSLSSSNSYDNYYTIKNTQDANDLLLLIIQSGRGFWGEVNNDCKIILGETKTLDMQWHMHNNGYQYLNYTLSGLDDNKSFYLLPVSPLWYYDSSSQFCGMIQSEVPADLIVSLLQLPPVAPDVVAEVQRGLDILLPNSPGLRLQPINISDVKPASEIEKTVALCLSIESIVKASNNYYTQGKQEFIILQIEFLYDSNRVKLSNNESAFFNYNDGFLTEIKRDAVWEQSCVEILKAKGLVPLILKNNLIIGDDLKFSFIFNNDEGDQKEDFQLQKLMSLRALANNNSWSLEVSENFPVQVTAEIDEWYSDIDEGSGIDWFSLSLGIIVENEKINLLPLLVDLISNEFNDLSSKTLSQLSNSKTCSLRLPNGTYVLVPFERIKNILMVLCELFDDKPLNANGKLDLSQLQAGLLIEIEKAIGATQLRWFGGDRIRNFARKLTDFSGIKIVKPAKTLKAKLREYQQEGLNWIQFLRTYELGGILADDMGLGKTVQTIAHFSVEKAASRLTKPSLLVVPTSLVNNWAAEIQKFAPNLSVLVLHGSERKDNFAEINTYNIIITTYPLVFRDKDILLSQDYYYVVLDEAQYIKNTKAKITQIILQINAKHRLCLTGTPMENNLGELWSLFHFVLPGLLGNQKQFKQIFRTPIERHADDVRHSQLISRIKPFILRRRKDDVLQELPMKTEIIRMTEIEGAQRDLYESVRLSMEKNVRDSVSQKGFNRSQIIILDALLKLRQICCAPSLLKLKSVKNNIDSAKLNDLMSFLPNLLAEGRKVLLFSSFTSMLALIEDRLTKNNIPYVKITGSTRDRQTPVEQFQQGKVPLFLISLKAGGVGLNLTAADTVIHYDPWWNPAAEQQATDRSHRIGQNKAVFVYKLISKGTVEEKILIMQEKKKALIAGIVEQKHYGGAQLTQEDLSALFEPL
jgi:superfamily II DNA or RNA helicase